MIDDLIFVEQLLKKANMKDRYRYAFIARYVEGKTYKEVGQDLGISASRAQSIVMSAILRMKQKNDALPMWMQFYPCSESKPKPKRIEEPISEEEYYRLLKLEEL